MYAGADIGTSGEAQAQVLSALSGSLIFITEYAVVNKPAQHGTQEVITRTYSWRLMLG